MRLSDEKVIEFCLVVRKESNMAKVLKCNDINPGCSFEARGNWIKLAAPSAMKAKRGNKKRVRRERRKSFFALMLSQLCKSFF